MLIGGERQTGNPGSSVNESFPVLHNFPDSDLHHDYSPSSIGAVLKGVETNGKS